MAKKKTKLQLYRCGQPVLLKNAGINGIITACCIRFRRVEYEISYFGNGEQFKVWANKAEFTCTKRASEKIGFKVKQS